MAKRDFNNDGIDDDVWQYFDGSVAVWLNSATLPEVRGLAISGPGSDWEVQFTGDFNGDGKSDLLWFRPSTNEYAFWGMDGTTDTTHSAAIALNSQFHIFGVGDADGNGTDDVFVQRYNGDFAVHLIEDFEVEEFGELISYPYTQWDALQVGDTNGDGFADIIFQNNLDFALAVNLMEDDYVIDHGVRLENTMNTSWRLQAAGDMDGDGKVDLVLRNIATGEVSIQLMDGINIATHGAAIAGPGGTWEIAGTGDYNGDGRDDISWVNADRETAKWFTDVGGTTIAEFGEAIAAAPEGWHLV